ncbi:MAG: hypothetical protein QFB86_02265 [Patescibacteria group bacterium]|nr:hypothetical protein [Patescibacteria group bacterium]
MKNKLNLLTAGVITAVAAGAFGAHSSANKNTGRKATSEACLISEKHSRAAREILKNLTQEKTVTYNPNVEAICGESRVPAPLYHNGKYFSLSLVNEKPVVSTLPNPTFIPIHRDGADFISHRGVVDLDNRTGIPGVKAKLSDGSTFEIAVAHVEPAHRG